MDHETEIMNLIDLVSEKHLALRKSVSALDTQELNKTETHILSLLSRSKPLSIAEIGRIIHISRQGTHKSVQGLLSRGLVQTVSSADNQRDRYLTLTPEGEKCNERLTWIKQELERRITAKLGSDKVGRIKAILTEDWLD